MTSITKKCKQGTTIAFLDNNGQFRTGVIKRVIKKGKNKGSFKVLPTAYDQHQIVPSKYVKEVLA